MYNVCMPKSVQQESKNKERGHLKRVPEKEPAPSRMASPAPVYLRRLINRSHFSPDAKGNVLVLCVPSI